MRKLLLTGTVFAIAGGILFGWVGLDRPTRDQQEVKTSRKGTPLAEIIRGPVKDGVVTVEKDSSPPSLIEPPPGMGQLEWMTSRAPLVLLVRIEQLDPTLTPARDWITTVVRARVLDIMKKPAGDAMSVNDKVVFQQDGGEVSIGETRVRAVLPWTDGFQRGSRYLIFAEYLSDRTLQVTVPASYMVDDVDRVQAISDLGKARTESNVRLADAQRRIAVAKEAK